MSITPSRKNILILSFTLTVVMLGYGMTQPIIPFLVTKLGASGRDLGVLSSLYAAMQLVCAPFCSTLSDRVELLTGALGFFGLLLVAGFAPFLLATGVFVLAVALIAPAAYLSVFGGEHLGALMGLNTAFASLGRVFGPLWAGFIFFDINHDYHLSVAEWCCSLGWS